MSPQDFFYWLQGFIELTTAAGSSALISPVVADCIMKHADLVVARDRGEGFVDRGEGFVEVRTLVRLASRATSEAEAKAMTGEIVAAVSRVFEHVIDPKAGGAGEQARLNNLHGGNVVARC